MYVCLKRRMCLKMRLSISFDIMWSPGAAIYTKSFLFSHSKWISQGRWKSKIDKVWLRWMGRKMRSCKWHTFWMVPWLIRCFIVILYWEKILFMRNLATVLFSKPKFSGKFQRFNAIDGSVKMLKYIWISTNFN